MLSLDRLMRAISWLPHSLHVLGQRRRAERWCRRPRPRVLPLRLLRPALCRQCSSLLMFLLLQLETLAAIAGRVP
jgi:hypothetical protein